MEKPGYDYNYSQYGKNKVSVTVTAKNGYLCAFHTTEWRDGEPFSDAVKRLNAKLAKCGLY